MVYGSKIVCQVMQKRGITRGMEKVSVLAEKSVRALKAGGVKELFRRTQFYVKNKKNPIPVDSPGKYYMDVLFINGCYLPHPSRYRVTHQREQLLAGNMTSNEVFYTDLTLDLVWNYRLFIFYRCPYTKVVGKFIQLAKKYHKTVLFDIDDLVIDRKYTDGIPYIKQMKKEEKKVYDEGIALIQKTLRLCDGAITTTECLARELKHYVPEVYINRNVVSDRMEQISEWAIYDRDSLPLKREDEIKGKENIRIYNKACKIKREREKGGIRLGYFSGSITHNDDFQIILPVLVEIMKEYENVELYLVGELNFPSELLPYQNRIKVTEFVDWQQLPRLIASIDINLVPLQNGIFNEAKSENKWMEAALVKVPTIASRVGAFEKRISEGETGYLCGSKEEWIERLKELIEDENKRKTISQAAYQYVKRYCTTMETGYYFAKYIRSKLTENIIFVLPNIQISGGMLVVLKHCKILYDFGMDVCIFQEGYEEKNFLEMDNFKIPVLNKNKVGIFGTIDKGVATLWSTMDFVVQYPNIKERFYLVQGYETNFGQPGEYFRFRANQTYNSCVNIQYITISKWCQKWLKNKYEKEAYYVPNGLDTKLFYPVKRDFSGKIRILIEGNCNDFFKNVDESFRIIELLDREKYEIWYLSYQEKKKEFYQVDRFFHKIVHEKVADLYRKCHILIKSSIMESFSYPPLEMMATGGYVVVAPNEGNIEYLKDGYNCLFYQHSQLQTAVKAIERICIDQELRDKLYQNGIQTAQERDWELIKREITFMYKRTKSKGEEIGSDKEPEIIK